MHPRENIILALTENSKESLLLIVALSKIFCQRISIFEINIHFKIY